MRTLAVAIFNKLTTIGGSEVYHGVAEKATMPYYVFTLGPSMRRSSSSTSKTYGATYAVPFSVNVYGQDEEVVADKLEEIIESFKAGLEVDRHFVVRLGPVSHFVEEDPEEDPAGNEIWHGIVNFEATLSRNYGESSSSESSASSVSASSVSASSVSASSVSASSVSASSASSSRSASSASSVSASSASSDSSVSTSSYSSASSSSSSTSGP